MKSVLIVTLGLALAGPAVAQVAPRAVVGKKAVPPRAVTAKNPVSKTKPPSAQRLDFTKGDLVEAGVDSGAGGLVDVLMPRRFSRLIPIRTDFLPELLKSAEDL